MKKEIQFLLHIFFFFSELIIKFVVLQTTTSVTSCLGYFTGIIIKISKIFYFIIAIFHDLERICKMKSDIKHMFRRMSCTPLTFVTWYQNLPEPKCNSYPLVGCYCIVYVIPVSKLTNRSVIVNACRPKERNWCCGKPF